MIDMPTDPDSHPLAHLPPEVISVFEKIIRYRVDPDGKYYGIDKNVLLQELENMAQINVVAIDSEYRYERKGHMYDPILQSFVQGAGGRISTWDQEQDNKLPIVLRGITKRKQMDACREQGRDFFYMDTGYFGNGKKKSYHRITRNNVQNFGPVIDRPGDRLATTGVSIKKVRATGSKILLAPPSQKLLNLYDINLEEWMAATMEEIKQHTDREIVVRLKQPRSVRINDDTIEQALDNDVYCLVTYSSIAATESILHGKPAIALGPNAAAPMCSLSISEIESIRTPSLDEIDAWARHLAYCQFTEAEMRDGTAWRILNGD
jgi:hypothetical protein